LSFITLWEEWQQARAALERVEEVLHQCPESPALASAPARARPLRGQITFENVSFAYGNAPALPVLQHVTFDIAPEEHVGIVGRSGSGKTTLARLVLGLYRPTQGRVLIDGIDLGELDVEVYRQQVGVVLQENLLLAGTIRDNIALGDCRPDPERIEEVARLAGAHEFITALPQGYRTVLGELGLTVSGGQRQRVNLARALYRNPRLLILDEATSALDTLSERAVENNLAAILGGRTVLIIAHDLAAVRHARCVLVLEDGLLVEQGTPEELLARGEVFFSLAAR
jgi:ATP-binding cassette subfamily B protein